MNTTRKTNIGYATEVVVGKLNGSSPDVEKKSNYNNASFTKKISGKAMVSSSCQKANMIKYLTDVKGEAKTEKVKSGSKIVGDFNPYTKMIDDVHGYMAAGNIVKTADEYNNMTEEEKIGFVKASKESYKKNVTKKRISRLQMNPLVCVNGTQTQYNICSTNGDSLPFTDEIYGGVMYSIANLDIENIGKFIVSDTATEYRDFDEKEAKKLGVTDLTYEQKIERAEKVLKALEFLSISGNQTNYLTDTKPKFVILCEYSWGNNAFQGIVNSQGIDIEMLKQALKQNEEHRLSDVWIGCNKFLSKKMNESIKQLKEEFKDNDFIKFSDVHDAFDGYINYLKQSK